MSWNPVVCIGRRYPTAPARARCGCLERAPGWWFCSLCGFNPPLAAIGSIFYPIRFVGGSPSFGVDIQNNWFGRAVLSSTRSVELQVWTVKEAGIWTIYSWFQDQPTTPYFNWIRYKRQFPDGFPRWENSMTLPFDAQIGWMHGVPATTELYTPFYSQIAPNACIAIDSPE